MGGADVTELAADIGQRLRRADNSRDDGLDIVVRSVAETFRSACTLSFFGSGGREVVPAASWHPDPGVRALIGEYVQRRRVSDMRLLPRLQRRSESVLVAGEDLERLVATMQPSAAGFVERAQVRSFLLVPVIADGEPIGVIALTRVAPELPHDDADRERLEHLARRIATDIDTERLVRDLRTRLGVSERTQEALRRAAGRFRSVFDHAPIGIALLEPTANGAGRILDANDALAGILGFERSQLLGADPLSFLAPDDRKPRVDPRRLLSGEVGPYSMRRRFVRRDGRTIDARVKVSILFTDGGRPDCLICQVEDVTEQVWTREQLERSEARHRQIVETMREGVWVIDGAGETVFANEGVARILATPRHEILGRSFEELVASGDRERARRHLAELDDGGDGQLGLGLVRPGGDVRRVDASTTVLTGDGGEVQGVLLLVSDVTDRVRAEESRREHEALLQGIFAGALDAIVTIDAAGSIVMFNPAAERLFGRPAESAVDRSAVDLLVAPADRQALRDGLAELARRPSGRRAGVRYELEALRADGTAFPAELSVSLVAGEPLRFTGHVRDISERRESERERARREAHRDAVASVGGIALAGAPRDEVLGLACDHVLRLTAASRAEVWEVVDAPAVAVRRAHRGEGAGAGAADERTATLDQLLERVADEPSWTGVAAAVPAVWPEELAHAACAKVRSAHGDQPHGVLCALTPDPQGFDQEDLRLLESLAGVLAAATERDRIEQARRHEMLHDRLTGLPNRELYVDRLSAALERAPVAGTTVSVLVIDLDRFKYVNDVMGHVVGDEILRQVVDRLRRSAGAGRSLARLGGDKFAVLCEADEDGEKAAVTAAARLLDDVAGRYEAGGTEIVLSATVGVACSDGTGHDAHALLRDADLAMHRAKHHGGSRVEVFDAGMRQRLVQRVSTETDLRRALSRDELELHYQPLVSLTDGRVVGVEALMRWSHPELGLVAPARFIPVAEESGLIVPMGEWALAEACRQLAAWDAAGVDVGYVSVNLSGLQLRGSDLRERVAEALAASGVAANRLVLEVTESVLMENASSPRQTLEALRSLGVRLFLDDFGTGYSSLGYLRRLPLDAVKIDRSFVESLTTDASARHLIESILGMARGLGLSAIAEGIETVAQSQWLRRLGCSVAQGYLLASPAAPDDLGPLLRDGAARHVAARAFGPIDVPGRDEGGSWVRGEDEVVTLAEAAQTLGVSASTVRRWADDGRLPAVRTAGGHRRFKRSDLRGLRQKPVAPPRLRTLAAPPAGLPPLVAEVLAADGVSLAVRAGRSTYEEDRPGWLASPDGRSALERLGLELATTAEDAEPAIRSLAEALVHDVREAGVGLLELDLFLTRFVTLVVREVQGRGGSRDDVLDARRVLAFLRAEILRAVDRS